MCFEEIVKMNGLSLCSNCSVDQINISAFNKLRRPTSQFNVKV
jgi:hypothetical protein